MVFLLEFWNEALCVFDSVKAAAAEAVQVKTVEDGLFGMGKYW